MIKTSALALCCLFFSTTALAVKIKIATIVPTGTNWATTLKDMGKQIKKETKGKVKFHVFYGGSQGDEPDVLRKIRVGQLHGGVFTGKTLGDIYPDSRAIEIPFNFYNDEDKALSVLMKKSEDFNSHIEKKGFINLGFYGIGKVYVVSTKKVESIKQLKGIKMWAWEGDKIVRAMMDSLGLVSVPLSLPDVMSSLSTGIIEAAYAPPLGILALQWQSKVKYLIDFPTAYSIGALMISKRGWKKISKGHQVIVRRIATKYINLANKLAKEDNQQALDTLKGMGIKFVNFSKEDIIQAEVIRNSVISKLRGSFLSDSIIKEIEGLR